MEESKKKKAYRKPEYVTRIFVFKREDGLRVEEQFDLGHLQQLRYWFRKHQPPPILATATSAYSPTKKEYRQPGLLTPEEFKETLVKVLGTHEYDDQMDNLFTKLDTSCDGYVDWNEFCTYMLLQFRENDYMRGKKLMPFRTEAKIRHIVHNRQETTTKMVSVEGPLKYVTVSKEGAICVWDTQLHLERHYSMTEAEEDPRVAKRRVKVWVTDAVYMPNIRKIAIGSTGRDIRFFDATSTQYFEEFHLFGLPDVPCCMDYYFDRKNSGGESMLVYGDDTGDICIFRFMKPVTQLFDTPFKKGEGVQSIFFKDFNVHSRWVRHSRLEDVHPEIIRKVMYLPENNCVMSSSASPSSSVVVMDVMRKKRTYVFKLSKGCECFDYNKNVNIMVTGSTDHVLRIWNPYVVSKPVAILEGHAMGIVDVKIHEGLNQIFSYSRDATLKAWDIKEHTCLQTVFIKFPSSLLGRLPEYGAFTMHLQHTPYNSLLITANDYVAMLKLGPTAPPASLVPTTHLQQLCSALYNPFFKTVVTGADDSTIGVWDLESGAKSMLFTNAHGDEEITSMTFDSSWRRLMTGSRNGVIKVWNIQNGHNLHQLEAVMDAEVTGIVPMSDKKMILAVGWNRMITQYDDSNPDNTNIKARTSWKGGHIHQEDILAVAYLPPNILATASFDGEICIWSMETEMMLRKMRRSRQRAARSSTSSKRMASAASSRGTTPAGSNSRPNSRHRKSHRPPPGQLAPVDKLLFLQARAKVKGTEAAILVSSEAGTIRWWSIYNPKHELGYFYAPEQPDESVLGLCTNTSNSILISGDTQGTIAMWSIINYCTTASEKRTKTRPSLEHPGWSAHDAAIVSVEYVEHEHGTFILSASTDRTAKLWSLQGLCVGTFGQKQTWNLREPSTWAEPPPESPRTETPVALTVSRPGSSYDVLQEQDESEDNPSTAEEIPSAVATTPQDSQEDGEGIATIERGETLVVDDSDKLLALPKMPKAVSVGPGARKPLLSPGISKLHSRSKTFAYGSSHNFSIKSMLGCKADKKLAQRSLDRQGRRDHFGDVDYSQANRMGKICCPYAMLETPSLSEIQLPANLPVSMRMQSQGYTSDSLTVPEVVRNMDLSYYGEAPSGATSPQRSRRASSMRPLDKLPAIRKSKTYIGFSGKSPNISRRTSVYSHS